MKKKKHKRSRLFVVMNNKAHTNRYTNYFYLFKSRFFCAKRLFHFFLFFIYFPLNFYISRTNYCFLWQWAALSAYGDDAVIMWQGHNIVSVELTIQIPKQSICFSHLLTILTMCLGCAVFGILVLISQCAVTASQTVQFTLIHQSLCVRSFIRCLISFL